MHASFRAKLLAGAIALCVVPFVVPVRPAYAQMEAGVGFDTFHDRLEPYGAWLYSDRWGTVWQPTDVPDDFQPYETDGHWVYTDDYGWLWVSDYPWGDVAFHYGRWVDDPDDGWLWIPGYTWAPAWVVWRSGGDYVGWMPMPPDDDFLDAGDVGPGFSLTFDFGDRDYGYRRWYGRDYDEDRFARNWVFVNMGHMGDRDWRRDAVRDPRQVVNIYHDSHNVTNYTVVNNYVVNRSINVHAIERAAGHPIRPVPARTVIRHPDLVATVEAGRQARARWRTQVPVGRGVANSAPPPPRAVVDKLSTHFKPRNGRPAAHLFTRTTVTQPQAMQRFHGAPPHGVQPMRQGQPMHEGNPMHPGQPMHEGPVQPGQPMHGVPPHAAPNEMPQRPERQGSPMQNPRFANPHGVPAAPNTPAEQQIQRREQEMQQRQQMMQQQTRQREQQQIQQQMQEREQQSRQHEQQQMQQREQQMRQREQQQLQERQQQMQRHEQGGPSAPMMHGPVEPARPEMHAPPVAHPPEVRRAPPPRPERQAPPPKEDKRDEHPR